MIDFDGKDLPLIAKIASGIAAVASGIAIGRYKIESNNKKIVELAQRVTALEVGKVAIPQCQSIQSRNENQFLIEAEGIKELKDLIREVDRRNMERHDDMVKILLNRQQ